MADAFQSDAFQNDVVFTIPGFQVETPPPPPTPPVIVVGGAASYPGSDYRFTQRLTRSEWLRLIYGPEGPTLEQLSELRLQEFLEDDDLSALMLL